MQAPSWMAWWPGPFGRSWAFDALSMGSPAAVVGGLIWLLAGLALVGAVLGIVGIPVLADAARTLLVSGAFLGLVAVALHFHPFYAVALPIDVASRSCRGGTACPRCSATGRRFVRVDRAIRGLWP